MAHDLEISRRSSADEKWRTEPSLDMAYRIACYFGSSYQMYFAFSERNYHFIKNIMQGLRDDRDHGHK